MTSRKTSVVLPSEVETMLEGIPLPVIERYIERRARLRRQGDSAARCPEMSYEHGQERCLRTANHRTKCVFVSDVGEGADLAAMHAEDASKE